MDHYDNNCEGGQENNLLTFKHIVQKRTISLVNSSKKSTHNLPEL